METKYCACCQTTKSIDCFGNCKSNKDGLEYTCKKCKSKKWKLWYNKNKEKKIKQNKKYKVENRERVQKQDNKRFRERLKEDKDFHLLYSLRTRMGAAIKRDSGKKAYKSIELLGADIPTVRKHIESLFVDGMTWDNYGVHGWHIDHIKPCSCFDLTNPDEQKKCFHYTNLQPLWWKDNLQKKDSFNE